MLSLQKRISKLIHYYKKYSSFQNLFKGRTDYDDMLITINQQFSDLSISYQEVRAFYCGNKNLTYLKDEFENKPEINFYLAGEKFQNESR